MKNTIKFITVLMLFSLVATSCRKEESILIEGPQNETLKANSAVANLLRRTSMKDGSDDNIVDNANCFSLDFPFTVFVNGMEITVTSEDDLDTIEDIFDEFDDDEDTLEIDFPVTVVFSDFSEMEINSQEEFENFVDDCEGENEYDDDIECLDLEYPITASVFNSNNELIDTITFTTDEELYNFLDDLEDEDIVNIDFPITVILADGTEVSIPNLDALEDIIDEVKDDCDEDDDYDYNDDDCDNCSTEQLTDFLTNCDGWMVDDIRRNGMNLEDQYEGYTFTFDTDGTITVDTGSESLPGTWESNGSENNIIVSISIPDLTDFNGDWMLHEIEQEEGEVIVELELENDDELEFRSNCNP